jgi:superfamily II DNA or RNA helicase
MANRPYQEKALSASKRDWSSGQREQLFVMATGTGKTHTFAQLPYIYEKELPGQMLVLAHREELLDQAIAKIRAENPHKRVDKEKAAHVADPYQADIIVASVASMTEKRMLKYNWTKVDKIVIDEAHHSTAPSYLRVLDTSGFALPYRVDPRILTGWTATPNRGDGSALATVYKKLSYTYTIRDAIEDGWLVDIRGYRVRTDTSLDGVKVTAGDFNQKALADTVNTYSRNTQAYNAWVEKAKGLQTIGFCVDIKHAQDMAALFRAKGIEADAVWGDDPDRKKKLDLFRAGEIKVLFNCGILTEGFDMWQVMCVLNCAPTKSPVKYAQCIGRATRLQELDYQYNLNDYRAEHMEHALDSLDIKEFAIVIDMVDNSTRNSLVLLPTLMGLPANMDLHGESLVGAARKIEEAQKEYPHLDLSAMPDVSKLKSFIEEVNLFEPVFRPEVESGSEMSWHTSATGGYVLLLPDKETVRIEQNLLDKFVMTAMLNGQKYAGERDSLSDAFAAADSLVIAKRPDAVRVIKREQAWHEDPATDAQLKTIKKFYKGRQIPPGLSKGKASRLISACLAGKS